MGRANAQLWPALLIRGLIALILTAVVTFSADHSPVFGLAVFAGFSIPMGLVLAWSALSAPEAPMRRGLIGAAAAVSLLTAILAVLLAASGSEPAAVSLSPVLAAGVGIPALLELIAGVLRGPTGQRSRDHVSVGVLGAVVGVVLALLPDNAVVTVGILGAWGAVSGVFLVIAALSEKWSGESAVPSRETAQS